MDLAIRAVVLAGILALAMNAPTWARTNTKTAVTVTNSSTQMLAASADGPRTFLSVKNESTTATIACNFGATAVANTAGNYTISPGQVEVWGPFPIDFPMIGLAVNCISSAATSPATIESNP